jgi:hypothetical protein
VRRAGLAILAILVLVAAGCGGTGGKRLTAAELQSRIDAICVKYQQRAGRELEPVESDPRLASTSSREVARFGRSLEHVATLVGQQLDDLRALRPPDALAARYSAALRSYARIRSVMSQGARAARKGDRRGIAVAIAKVDAMYRAIQSFGFNNCG